MNSKQIAAEIIKHLKSGGEFPLHEVIYSIGEKIPPREFDNFRARARRAASTLEAQGVVEINEGKKRGNLIYLIKLT
jgi:hypothetical protein